VSLRSFSAGLSLFGKRKPLFLKAKPVSLSLGTPLWQKLQFLPVCLAKLGVASAFDMASINATAMGAATKALACAMVLNLRRPGLADERPCTLSSPGLEAA
jgi:hypothetical protein